MSALPFLFLYLLASAGIVDPCAVPELASSPEFAEQCTTNVATPGLVAPPVNRSTDISNGF